jgi:putative heme-binding domain-containing protein
VVALNDPAAMARVIELLEGQDAAGRLTTLTAINESLQGRRQVAMPAGWPAAFEGLMASEDEALRSQAIALGTTFGDPKALEAVRSIASDADAAEPRRLEALAALLKARDPGLPPVLRTLVQQPGALRAAAIRGLAAYDDAATADTILGVYDALTAAEKRDAMATLAARVASARTLLDAIEAKRIVRADLSADVIRNLRNLKDDALNARIAEVWGQVRDTPAAKAEQIEKYRRIVRAGYVDRPDPALGRAVYVKTCGQCHTLFGSGSNIGPDLTGSNRADLDYVLTNVVDPSALVGKDYQATVLALTDGRTLTGIVKSEDSDALTLVTATETVVIPKGDVEERALTEQSLMPEDQWTALSDHEIRSLVAYLASPSQVPLTATPENAASFFNGKDLTGWTGDPALWSVEDGEIVGRSKGLEHNAFLVSALSAADFKLSFEVKLVGDEGNSGVQFRSEALPDGEMKGPQADIGPGWWGKLYDENGRGLLWDRSGEPHVKKGEWNRYEVEAVGSKIVTRINGQTCVDLDDPAGAKRGVFAFQLHSGGPTEVRFRDVKLEVPAGGATASR